MHWKEKPLRKIAGIIALAALAACSRGVAPVSESDLAIEARQTDNGDWRVDYGVKRPLSSIDLGQSLGDYRLVHWRRTGEGGRIAQRGGRDYIDPPEGMRTFSEASFIVEPAAIDLRKEYEPFIPMGDGGLLIYTGHILPFAANGERMRAALSIKPVEGAHVSAFDKVAPEFDEWESPFSHPAFVYVGDARVIDTPAMVAIVDATAPEWIRSEVADFAPAIASALHQLMARALPAKPNVFVAMGDRSEEGRLSYSGDALPGQYQMTLAGGAWNELSERGLSVLRRSTAHEAAHLWQEAARPKSDAVPGWIHEGGADALAAEAMAASGRWSVEEKAADLERAKRQCAIALRQTSLNRIEAAAQWDDVYACGHIINVAAAGEAGVAAFWREFIARSAAEGYDEAGFLALAGERAGPEAMQAIRDLTRINEARPEIAIDAMLK